jgi:endonuclease/exonuclease/phosphatase family metal-dependent hydrolase
MYQKGGVCIFICSDVCFNHVDLSVHYVAKTLEICAVKLELTGKSLIIICVHRPPSGDFGLFLQLLEQVISSSYGPFTEFLICGDFNVIYLQNCNQKQQLSVLLGTFNMIHTVNFPTRVQNYHASAIDNIFIDTSRSYSYITFI